jgi:hypothetical protein
MNQLASKPTELHFPLEVRYTDVISNSQVNQTESPFFGSNDEEMSPAVDTGGPLPGHYELKLTGTSSGGDIM